CASGHRASGRVPVLDGRGSGRCQAARSGEGDRATLGGPGPGRHRRTRRHHHRGAGRDQAVEGREPTPPRRRRDPESGNNFLREGTRPPQPMMAGFIDQMNAEGHAVESICRVLREQGCQIAARTYQSWKAKTTVVAARTIDDAHVLDKVRDLAWSSNHAGQRQMTPEGLYG